MTTTLLKKVKTIEEEAEEIVAEAQQEGEKSLQHVRSREQEMLERVQAEASARGQQIVKERVAGMKDEIGKIKDESNQSVEMVQRAAESNRPDVLQKAQQLFMDEYLTN